jgi:hypothetical protein
VSLLYCVSSVFCFRICFILLLHCPVFLTITEINKLKAQMARTFDMKNLGAARQILGMEIFRDRRNGIDLV